MNQIENGYKKLYRCTQEKYSSKEYTRFVALKGDKYDSLDGIETPRLMIIGRAVNGWDRENLDYVSEEAFAKKAKSCFENKTRFTKEWGLKRDTNGVYSEISDELKYYLSRSPFWNCSKTIWQELMKRSKKSEAPDWFEYIAWSNLYKVSPRKGGNPDNELCRIQADACIDILSAEIKLLKPTHILMMVGESWFKWKKGDFSKIFTDGSLNMAEIVKTEKKQNIVKYLYVGADLRVVVTNRPERHKKDDFVNEVMNAFGSKE